MSATADRLSCLALWPWAESIEEVVKGSAGFVEGTRGASPSPVVLDLSDLAAGFVEEPSTLGGRDDELGATVAGVGLTLEVAGILEFVHKL